MKISRAVAVASVTVLGVLPLVGCDKDKVEDIIDDIDLTKVEGTVVDNNGQPVVGAEIKLYDLLANQNFVEGGDAASGVAYIDREAVLGSQNALVSAVTDAQGHFEIVDIAPSAFLAVASHGSCSAGFAGFDEETGILSLETLIKPQFGNGLTFSVPGFVVACSTPPAVGPDGNSDAAPPFDPPVPPVTCDAEACAGAGGACEDTSCVITCAPEACAASGGSCVDGACAPPACDEDACTAAGGSCDADACVTTACDTTVCEAAGGTCSGDGLACDIPPCLAAEAECTASGGACSADGTTCDLPACAADEDCQAAQPGAFCANPGDVSLASCEPPAPGEIVPPAEVLGWTGFRVTDAAGNVLADAGAGDQVIDPAAIPSDGVVRIEADFSGPETLAFLHIQSGGTNCPDLPPRTDFLPIELAGGGLATADGAFTELVLHGGYQKLILSTTELLGTGAASHVIQIGEPCTAPAQPFVASLSWDAGPGQPADLDLNIWNAAGELVFVGKKQAAWGQLKNESKGPGPEVFEAIDPGMGPFTVKVQFFSGKPREVTGKLRIQRTVAGEPKDETFSFTVGRPKDVAEIGAFTAQ